jgi:hypothetical protein
MRLRQTGWLPELVDDFMDDWQDLDFSRDGQIQVAEAARLMVRYQQFSDALGDQLAQATLYEESCKFSRNNAKVLARLRSDAKTDRGKDDEANSDIVVKKAEMDFIKANAYRLLLEKKHEAAIRGFYLAKNVLDRHERSSGTW